MSLLLIRLAGSLQSWGTQDRFVVRTTDLEPSFSGVVGMIAFALGRQLGEPIHDLARLEMGVRVDRPGEVVVDFQTVRGGKDGTGGPADMVVSYRHYLADACFLACLSGPREELAAIAEALARPHTSLFLGRRCCIPSAPLVLPDGLREGDMEAELGSYPWLGRDHERPPDRARLQLPASPQTATTMRMDFPLAFTPGPYAPRYVREDWAYPKAVA